MERKLEVKNFVLFENSKLLNKAYDKEEKDEDRAKSKHERHEGHGIDYKNFRQTPTTDIVVRTA
jgi:antitoxin component YwqK of YwqJK toxin-antitoxin module